MSEVDDFYAYIIETEKSIQRTAPETSYRDGYLDALSYIKDFLTENYEIEAALDEDYR